MKNAIYFFAIVAMVVLGCAVASAQSCTMVTYSDLQFDVNGNLLGTNYTSIGASCGAQSAYAYVKLKMPDGSFTSNSASGSYSAQAVTLRNPAGGQSGDGTLEGTNYIVYPCIPPVPASFVLPYKFGTSFTWYVFSHDTTFDQVQPCPEPGLTISCSAAKVVFADPRDIKGVYVENANPWLRLFGHTFCSPLASIIIQQNTAPERPYCYDLS